MRILRATALYHLGELDKSQAECGLALEEIPDYQHNYRTRIQFLLARISLRRGDSKTARELVKEALSVSREHFYFPLIAEGHLLAARCIAATGGSLRRARAHCLRAHQTAKEYERPLLHATIWRTQAGIEARLKKPRASRTCFGKALLALKERLLHVCPENREGFRAMHIAPIEYEQEKLLGRNQTSFALFQRLPSAIDALHATRSDVEIAHKLVDLLADTLAHLMVQFWLKTGGTTPCQLAGGTSTRASIPRLLDHPSGQDSSNRGGFSHSDSKSAAFVRLNAGIQRQALLYFESSTGELTEVELDFLTCLGSIAAKHMVRFGRRPNPAQSGTRIELPDGNILVGRHPRMQQLFQEIRQVAATQATVVIHGEIATGKELVAKALHCLSRRAAGPFIAVNCGAIPESLVENELFGHKRAALREQSRTAPASLKQLERELSF